MTSKENFFLNTIDELKERLSKLTEYDILKASGLLRQLLIDGYSLVDQINKIYRVKIQYCVQKSFEFPELNSLPDGSEPKVLYGMNFILPIEGSSNIELLNLSDFLKYEVLQYQSENFTVLDVIKICANKYGGIHVEDVKKSREKSLDVLHNYFSLNKSSSILHSMYNISIICVNSLQPLAEAIKSKAENE